MVKTTVLTNPIKECSKSGPWPDRVLKGGDEKAPRGENGAGYAEMYLLISRGDFVGELSTALF